MAGFDSGRWGFGRGGAWSAAEAWRGLKAVAILGITAVLIASSNAGAAPKFSEWSTPVNLGPVVNSPVDELAAALSKDGLSLFLTSVRPGGLGGNDLWVSQRASVDEPWGAPVNLGATINTAANEGAPALSRDGHWLFHNSARSGGFGLSDIWVSYREHVDDDFGWQAPVNLGSGVNTAFQEQGSTYFENDDHGVPLLYFGSNRPGGLGAFDVYVSGQLPDGTWGAAQLVTELSTTSGDQRPSIRFDGLELFLFSNRPGGLGGSDIWVSTRDAVTDPWGTPVNLGPTVNSPEDDLQPHIASDRHTLYLTSNRPGGAGFDVYETTRTRA